MISGTGDHVPATQAKRHSKPTLVWGQQNLTTWSFHGNLLRWFRRKFPARKKVITGKQWSESKSSSSWAIGSKDFNGFQWTFTWPSHCWVAACPLDAQACRPAAPAPLEQPERHGEICWAACIGQDPALACWIPRPSPTHRISMLTQIHEPPVCLGGNMAQPVPSLEESSVFADETPKSTSNQWLRATGLLPNTPASVIFSDTRPSQWRASLNRKGDDQQSCSEFDFFQNLKMAQFFLFMSNVSLSWIISSAFQSSCEGS